MHVAPDVLAVPVLYLPLEHFEHAADPFTSLYSPATHAKHSAPSGPVYPLLHLQSVASSLAVKEYVAKGHSLHVKAELFPVSVEYLPAAHGAVSPMGVEGGRRRVEGGRRPANTDCTRTSALVLEQSVLAGAPRVP